MTGHDDFGVLARYYDAMMKHVDYDTWFLKLRIMEELLAPRPLHADMACGTGALMNKLRERGWRSFGTDLSRAMVRQARQRERNLPVAVADMRAQPFHERFDVVTCLFDSLNFLTEETDLRQAFREMAAMTRDGGLLYFDIITERMVMVHFAGQRWTEQNGRFSTTWESEYNRAAQLAETRVTINRGQAQPIRERIYPPELVKEAAQDAGLHVAGMFDAVNWKKPLKRTLRVDFAAFKNPAPETLTRFKTIARKIRLWLR